MSSYKVRKTLGDTSWFTHDRFGMFIHFGLYSMPARHEWVKTYEMIPEEKYDKYFKYFNPDMCDASKWARAAREAGMKYAVLTTKHHEGFCLFDSKYTDYKITNTPYGRDLVREYADAFRKEGLHVGFYYSLLDWHHPEFPIDQLHPRRKDKDAEEQSRGRDVKKYAEYMRNQVTELLTNYGKIDILWFDFSYTEGFSGHEDWEAEPWMENGGYKGKDEWESEKLIQTARAINPDIIIDNRTQIDQDLWTPEQFQPTEWVKDEKTGELLTWEACQTFSGSWGYHRDETSWKSPKMLIDMLVNTVSIGGNLIMNVGPTSRGYFDERAEKALGEYGKWLSVNGRSIYGCTMAEPEFAAPEGTRLTQSMDEKRLYIHILNYPFAALQMKNLAEKIDYAQFLHDGSELLYECSTDNGTVTFKLPAVKPNIIDPVIEVFLKQR